MLVDCSDAEHLAGQAKGEHLLRCDVALGQQAPRRPPGGRDELVAVLLDPART